MNELSAYEVAERLSLGEDFGPWLEELEALGPHEKRARIPPAVETTVALERLGVTHADATEIMRGLPEVEDDPALTWLLGRCYHRLAHNLGRLDAEVGEWPDLRDALGGPGRYFYAYVFLAALEDIRGWHRQRGIPDDVSWATLADLGRQMALHRKMYGSGGLDTQWWLVLHWRGALYQLGRLQFGPYRIASGTDSSEVWYEDDDAGRMGPGFRRGDPALGVHIPETGPLSPAACNHSFAWARDFFAQHRPEDNYRIATCVSWLLDDQLEEYLPEDSNLVRFQRRFRLVPGAEENDVEIFKFVFKSGTPTTTGVPQRTTLERAIVEHLRAGRHWRVRTGWLEL
jgi:GNAT-like C-terminal domain/N-acyltransferase N-terminal domain